MPNGRLCSWYIRSFPSLFLSCLQALKKLFCKLKSSSPLLSLLPFDIDDSLPTAGLYLPQCSPAIPPPDPQPRNKPHNSIALILTAAPGYFHCLIADWSLPKVTWNIRFLALECRVCPGPNAVSPLTLSLPSLGSLLSFYLKEPAYASAAQFRHSAFTFGPAAPPGSPLLPPLEEPLAMLNFLGFPQHTQRSLTYP